MFIEEHKGLFFLTKKVFDKKISVSLQSEKTQRQDIQNLSNKEYEFTQSLPSYQSFTNHLYDTNILTKTLKKETFLANLKSSGTDTNIIQHYENFPKHFIYESNKIEGSKIPYSEVEKIIAAKKSTYKIQNEITEVQNSQKARRFLNESFLFNESHIKKLYHLLTKTLLQENGTKYPRGFKKVSIVVNNSTTTPPELVTEEMQKLLSFYKENKKKVFPLQLAFDFHLHFEKIHPFVNGNGRIGRLIMNKILLKVNFLPCIIFAENRSAYFNAIKSTEDKDKKKYYKFMLGQYWKSLEMV